MKFLLVVLIASSLAAQLSAQQIRPVKLRSICFQHVGDLKKLFAISGGEKPKAVEVTLFTTVISEEVDAFASDEMLTFAVPDEAAAGASKFKIIATAKAVPGPRQLVIFIPGAPDGSPYRCFVIDDSERNFPMGSTMAVNLSTLPFRLSIGEHLKDIAPGKIENIPMARKTNDRGQVSVIISIADSTSDGGWRAVNQTRWFTGTDKRDLAISYIHPRTKQAAVNCYGDTPSWITR
ncbi:MAG: hypothetical protein WEB53_15465 [Akkermansiaceae bacterium]